MRLFHFSDDKNIEVFSPRPAKTPAPRPDGREWVNGPLVRAIDDWHQPLYLFPRECPRVLVWPDATTTPQYLSAFKAMTACRMVAHIERRWLDRLSRSPIYRYELPPDGFESIDDAGTWASRAPCMPIDIVRIEDPEKALEAAGVELRVLPSLKTLAPMWDTSLHVIGIRLRAGDRPSMRALPSR
ncbi:MAG: DUF6886 family protein [Tardiphaga sp.]